MSRFAVAHAIPHKLIDGNDVVAVADAAGELIARARAGSGPGLIEAVTFRWYGHVDWRDDVDVGVNRSTADLESWRKRDPIARLQKALRELRDFRDDDVARVVQSLNDEIDLAWTRAMADPYPDSSALLDHVYDGAGR